MTPQHPELAFIRDDANWHSWADVHGAAADSDCQALAYRGLFTDYLTALDQGPVAVQLIRQAASAEQSELVRRDVVIRVGARVAAVASTLIDQSVLERYSWLNNLGSKAIGETLERRLGAVRTDIRYRRIVQESDLFANFSDESGLWGRRYRYVFDGGDLCITEIIAGSIIAAISRQGDCNLC